MKEKQCVCHMCGKPVKYNDRGCGHCEAPLTINCPSCNRETFISGNCRYCRVSLYITCPNETCGKIQLATPDGLCRFCGTKIFRRE